MDNPNHYEQFQRIIDREKMGEPSEPSANMSSMRGREDAVWFPSIDVGSCCLKRFWVWLFWKKKKNKRAPLLDAQPDDPVVVPQIDKPAVDIPAVAVLKQSNRLRKLPTWMNDFVTNSTVVSTPYPLSQSLSYTH
ncbi:hypothetical protein H5410_007416, partial [Solanum commersonii]